MLGYVYIIEAKLDGKLKNYFYAYTHLYAHYIQGLGLQIGYIVFP